MLDRKGYTIVDKLKDNGHVIQYAEKKSGRMLVNLTVLTIGIGIGTAIMGAAKSCEPKKTAPIMQDCNGCHRQHRTAAFTEYFRKAGSTTPQEMAEAVMATDNPPLMAAIAKVESGGNHTIRKAGYKRRHDGAFQVNPRYWGQVPEDAVGQALQAQEILIALEGKESIEEALNFYGGDSKGRYARIVLAELEKTP